jgi:hypothetical protein
VDEREDDGEREAAEKMSAQTGTAELDAEPFDVNYEELRRMLQASTRNTIEYLDQLIISSRSGSQKRLFLELFKGLILENARSSESIIYLFEYVKDLRASVLLLSLETRQSRGRTAKDVRRLRSKLDELLDSPAMVEIGKVLQNIQRISEERKDSTDRNPTKEYLR